MNSEALFSLALGLHSPWQVREITGAPGESGRNALPLRVGFSSGARFADAAGTRCGVHDTVERRWQPLRVFEPTGYLPCAVPRLKTPDGQVITVPVPWARPGSGVTVLFEALALALMEREMPVHRVAERLRVNPQRLWTVFNHGIGQARPADAPSGITPLGIDATATRQGHHDVTLGVEMKEGRVIHVTAGKGQATLQAIRPQRATKGVDPQQIPQARLDLSPAFIAGVRDSLPAAQSTVDRVPVVKRLNEAMDKVRQAERQEHEALKGHTYTVLKNPQHLSETQPRELAELIPLDPTWGEAYRLTVLFNDLWSRPDQPTAHACLEPGCAAVDAAPMPAFVTVAKTVRAHGHGLVHCVESRLSFRLLEGIHHQVQLAKRRARGFRHIDNFINRIDFLCGKRTFSYPRYFT